MTDGSLTSTNTATVTITVTAVNDAPVAVDDAVTTAEDTPVDIAVVNNDTDIDTAQAALQVAPGSISGVHGGTAVLQADSRTVRFTPTANANNGNTPGGFGFTYQVTDGSLTSTNSATVTITITAVNDAPVAVDDAVTTAEDTPVDVPVVGNDTDIDTAQAALQVAPGSISGVHGGTAVLQADSRTVRFTPAANANNGNTPGGFGFTYQVTDGSLTSTNTATVTITVSAVNDAPVANDQTVVTDEDTAKATRSERRRSRQLDVYLHDWDARARHVERHGAEPDVYAGPELPRRGQLYIPGERRHRRPRTSRRCRLPSHRSTIRRWCVMTFMEPMKTTPLIVAAPGVLLNDSDTDGTGDGDSLLINLDGQVHKLQRQPADGPPRGGHIRRDTGRRRWLRALDAFSADANNAGCSPAGDGCTQGFESGVSVCGGRSVAQRAALDGNRYADPLDALRHAVGARFTLPADADVQFGLNDCASCLSDDRGGLSLLITPVPAAADCAVVTSPSHGQLTLNPNGSLTYTPDSNYNGTDTFTYQANDTTADSNVATVTITVAAVNDAPVAVDDTATTSEDTSVDIVVVSNDTDIDTAQGTLQVAPRLDHQRARRDGGSAGGRPDGALHADGRRQR